MSRTVCNFCEKECETIDEVVDDSFYYEYGSESGVFDQVSTEPKSDCCRCSFRKEEDDE